MKNFVISIEEKENGEFRYVLTNIVKDEVFNCSSFFQIIKKIDEYTKKQDIDGNIQ